MTTPRSPLLVLALALGLLTATGCVSNHRLLFGKAIEEMAPQLPPASATCWLTPDVEGGGPTSPLAEEVFANYIVEKRLCRLVEKHRDNTMGYSWPSSDQCPCSAGVENCSGTCGGAEGVGLPMGVGGGTGPDNGRSGDPLLERFKKSRAQKVIVYRISELGDSHAVIQFRVSDVRSGLVEASRTVSVEHSTPSPRRIRD